MKEQIAKASRQSPAPGTNGAQIPFIGSDPLPPDSDFVESLKKLERPKPTHNEPLTVAIVGAGCAGLFVPMIFNKLRAILKENWLPELTVNCEVFEASSETRLGGRVYTHKFSQGGDHDYYDVGAMRFPQIPIMERQVAIR